MPHCLAEQHARRLVLEANVDADLAPLALQYLLAQFRGAVTGSGLEFQRERPARRIAAQPAWLRRPSRRIEQRSCSRRVVAIARGVGAVTGVERVHKAIGHRLSAI